MYEFLKNIIPRLIPQQWLFKNEIVLRKIYAFRLKGNLHYCNVCNTGLVKFTQLETTDLLCPFCGSLPRNRRLWQLLNEKNWLNGRVLDFSPSRCLHRKIEKSPSIDYISTDYVGEFNALKSYDITNIEEPSSSFDLIICFHVLEHIEEDAKAMKELYRILKKGAKAIIQTPFKDGDIFEDIAIRTPEERLKHFGQEDHIRVYSVQGLKKRLEQTGFDVQVLAFAQDQRMGMKADESILVASKER